MHQPLSPQQRQELMDIILEELKKPRTFPYDVDQIAYEMMARTANWLWYQQLEFLKKQHIEDFMNDGELYKKIRAQ